MRAHPRRAVRAVLRRIDSSQWWCRAYIALGNHFLVLQKVRDDDPISLQACKLLANYMQVADTTPHSDDDSAANPSNSWILSFFGLRRSHIAHD